jgi:hypothetical protein
VIERRLMRVGDFDDASGRQSHCRLP